MGITKQAIKEYFGSAIKAAAALEYQDRNSINSLPDKLTTSQQRNIIRRMKAEGLEIPKEWLEID